MENEEEKENENIYGQNFAVQFQTEEKKYYDIIIDIDSISKLFKDSWDIIYTDEGDEKDKEKKEKYLVIGVLGNKNIGKSYILQKISGNKLPLGYSESTKGISILYQNNTIFLDSEGFEDPLLEIPGIYELEIKDEKYKKKFEEDLKKLNDEINQANINNDEETLEKKINEKNEKLLSKKNLIKPQDLDIQIANFINDRNLTENFIQKFVLCNSDFLVCVIGQLNLSEQKFIDTIRSQLKNKKIKKLFIIHNLTTFAEKKQVEDYIEENFIDGIIFDLEKLKFQNLKKMIMKINFIGKKKN